VKTWEEPIHFWRAEHHSRHFMFEAFGASRAGALRALGVLLRRHAEQYGAADGWAESALREADSDDMVRQLQFGAGYRDGEKVTEE